MTSTRSPLTQLVAGPRGQFFLEDLRRDDSARVTVRFRRVTGPDWVDVVVQRRDDAAAALRGKACSVRYAYSREVASSDPSARDELAALLGGVLTFWDDWMTAHPGSAPADLLDAQRIRSGKLELSARGLLEILSPELAPGRPLLDGWRLEAVYPSSLARAGGALGPVLVFEFEHTEHGRVCVEVGPRDEGRQALARSAHFDVSYLTRGSPTADRGLPVARWLGTLLCLRDHPGLDVAAPSATDASSSPAHHLRAPEPALADAVLNLAIDAPCGQACAFCSVQETSPPWASGETGARLRGLLADLESNAAAGVRRVRVNGYDPLAFDGILEVASRIRDCGYQEVTLFSPCTAFEDASLVDALLDRLPEHVELRVPVYGASASVHDAVVGREGAFARLSRALTVLLARLPPSRITLLTVAVRSNLPHLLELRDWAQAQGLRLIAQTAYPSTESPRDRYRDAAPSFTEIARATLLGPRPLVVHGVPCCVYFQRAAELGLPLTAWLDPSLPVPPLPGREYLARTVRHRALPVPHSAFVAGASQCQHCESCALATACPKEILLGYQDLYGLGEIARVPMAELVQAARRPG